MDSYGVLGVSRNASMEEINAAFKALMDNYSEDKYIDNPLTDLAQKKRQEVEQAYDAIVKERAQIEKQRKQQQEETQHQKTADPEYQQIRSYINVGNITAAEQMLQEMQVRDAEWHYLSGCVFLRRGQYNEAYQSFKTATNKEPQNQEYRAALMRMEQQANSYRDTNSSMQQAQCCNCCGNLMIADCCCECMGGDLIPCC